MSDLLSIGASGVRAYQSALTVVGENIANASTPGYVKRNVVLAESAVGRGGFLTEIDRNILGGVDATGVSRAWDAFAAAEVRRGTADAAGTESAIPFLERIESTLDKSGLASGLTAFFNAGTALAADPGGAGPRAAMIESANGLAAAFRSTADGLAAVRDDVAATAQLSAGELSRLAAGLAETNAGIVRARPGGNAQAQLLDKRDKLLDDMAALAKIDVAIADDGTATVRLNEAGGPLLVDRVSAGALSITVNDSGSVAIAMHRNGAREAVDIRGGAIAGLIEAASRAAGVATEVDRLARSFAEGVNAVQAAGVDLDGNPGAPLFDASAGAALMTMVGAGPRAIAAAGPFTATAAGTNSGTGRLTATPDPDALVPATLPMRLTVVAGELVATDPVTDVELGRAAIVAGTPTLVAGLSVTITGDPAEDDAFTLAATGAGSRDNANLAALARLRTDSGYERDFGALVTQNAAHLASRRTIADAQVAIRDGAFASRDAVSGVNLDAEAVELLRFQQAYSASSRLIAVARETFQSILDASR